VVVIVEISARNKMDSEAQAHRFGGFQIDCEPNSSAARPEAAGLMPFRNSA
jgi:hypothetical protein